MTDEELRKSIQAEMAVDRNKNNMSRNKKTRRHNEMHRKWYGSDEGGNEIDNI